jgi:phosphotriesterase-related protein
MLSRRNFIKSGLVLLVFKPHHPYVISIKGKMRASKMGTTLIHEHFLVDFIGADKISTDRWDLDKVVDKILPHLIEAKAQGVETILDCTPNFLGRDVRLFKILTEKSGINILTNTGYYGAVGYRFLPKWAFTETAEQLAARWIAEARDGIDDTGVRPGFMKIAVNGGELSELETKLITAAGLTHLQTGLTICSHTGPAVAAFGQIAVLQKMGIQPDAFVWVHAQGEENKDTYLQAAKMGAWVSLDGIGWGGFSWGGFEQYANWIDTLKNNNCLHRVLISHDAGWYDPEKPDGENIVGYTNIFKKLIPLLEKKGFRSRHIDQLLVKNPAAAFAVRVRRV